METAGRWGTAKHHLLGYRPQVGSGDILSFGVGGSWPSVCTVQKDLPNSHTDVRPHTEVGNKQLRCLALDSEHSSHSTIPEVLVSQSAVVDCSM